MNINESIRDWITLQLPDFPGLAGVDIVTMGETADLTPPFLGIMESSAEAYTQGDVTLYGVSTFEITCELHTVPADEDNGGTTTADEQQLRQDLYNILGDRAAIAGVDGLNDWMVFDIRLAAPTTEASDGRRISRWSLSIVAAPESP